MTALTILAVLCLICGTFCILLFLGKAKHNRRQRKMTPARKQALQFFHDRGEVCLAAWEPERPSVSMRTRMMNAGELCEYTGSHPGAIMQCLTNLGRQRLHEADC